MTLLKSLKFCKWFLTKAKGFDAFSLIILPLKAYLEFWVGMVIVESYLPSIYCRVKPRTILEGVRHTLRSECACVWNFWWKS